MVDSHRTRRSVLGSIGATLTAATAGCSVRSPAQIAPTGNSTTESDGSTSKYTAVYEQVADSVVLIHSFDETGATSQGSGFLYDANHVVTNQHVVEGAEEVDIQFRDGSWESPTIVGTDFYSDLAVLRIGSSPKAADPLPLLAGDPAIGTEVIALGNPLGLDSSLSTGVVSGVDRTMQVTNGLSIPDIIQTDATVNRGNSGGPLVDLQGRAVGIINALIGGNIGFAISGALTERVVPTLIDGEDYRHSYLGIGIRAVSPPVAEANNIDPPRGLIVSNVTPGGPADGHLRPSDGEAVVSGVQVPTGGDVIVSMGGNDIHTFNGLATFMALKTSPGETVAIGIIRDGEKQTVEFELGARPPPAGQ